MNDLEELARLERECFERPYPPCLIERLLREHSDTSWVAINSGRRITGYLIAAVDGKSTHLISVATAPRERRKGIATFLLQNLLNDLRKRGQEEVWLEVKVENGEAISLYEKLGFERVAVMPGYYEDGSFALKMRKKLHDQGNE